MVQSGAGGVQRLSRILLVAALLLVLVLSLMKTEAVATFAFSDKLQHLGVFLMLAALAYGACRGARERRLAMAGLLGYGLLIECLQWPLPWREFSLLDWCADGIGIALWMLVARVADSRVLQRADEDE